MKNTIIISLLIVCVCKPIFAQIDKLIGSSKLESHLNVYDYSSPLSPNIEIKLWGSIGSAGIYTVPDGINLTELLSYAGGLTEGAELDEIKIIRKVNDNYTTIIIDYEQYLEDDEQIKPEEFNFVLKNGDVIFIPESSTWYQSVAPFTTVISAITSIVTLVYLINNSN